MTKQYITKHYITKQYMFAYSLFSIPYPVARKNYTYHNKT